MTIVAIDNVQAGKDLDAMIEKRVYGRSISWWSLYLVEGPHALKGNEWRHGLFSQQAFAEGRNAEVLIADGMGDMPAIQALHEDGEWRGIGHYSTDLLAAFRVVEKLAAHEYRYTLSLDADFALDGSLDWRAQFCSEMACAGESMHAPTPALAICRAALSAVLNP